MATEVKRLAETIQVTDVSRIVVTEIVEVDGRMIRAIRIWGAGSGEELPALEIQVTALTPEAIEITTPAIRF